LEENLRIIGEEKKFGRHIGKFMFNNEITAMLCPIISSFILKFM
jgi:hypothetical protein